MKRLIVLPLVLVPLILLLVFGVPSFKEKAVSVPDGSKSAKASPVSTGDRPARGAADEKAVEKTDGSSPRPGTSEAPATPESPARPATPDLSILPSARAEDKKDNDELGLAGEVKTDEYNDLAKKEKPCRGGMIRLRFPIDPKSLCPIIDNDQPSRTVHAYMTDSLIDRDKETFEWVPMLARYWRTCDVVILKKDGKRLEGRVVDDTEGKPLVFAEGAWKYTVARHEVEIDEKAGKVTWKEPFGKGSIEGKVTYWPSGRYTVTVDEKPAKTIEIKREEIGTVEEEMEGGKKESYPGVLRECVYEFKMRKGPKWHDGQPITADDVVWTYQTEMNAAVLDGHLKGDFSDNMLADPKEAVKKVDDDSVRYTLKKQYFRALSVGGTNYILPAHRYGAEKFKGDEKGFGEYFNTHPEHRHPVSSGRYKFGKWEAGKYVEIVRNDDWWASQKGQEVPWIDPQQPYLDKIQWITIPSKNAGLKALMNGEIDADFEIEQITWVDKETNTADFTKKFARVKYLAPPYTYIGWNLRRPDVEPDHAKMNFFKDPKVRTAMTMLIDRKKILEQIHYGLGEMVTGPFFARGPFNDPKITPLPYNPERAKTLLDQAGWIDHDGDGIRDKDGVPFEFTYSVHNARDYHLKIAEIVKQDIEKAGIKVNIKVTDFNSFIDTVNSRKFDAIRFAWGDPDCVESDPYQIWHSSQWDNKGSNHTGYSNPEVDDVLVKARRELDFRKRQRMFRKVHRIIAEDQPYTFLFNLYELYFYDKKFRNVKFYVIGENPYNLDEWFIPKELQK